MSLPRVSFRKVRCQRLLLRIGPGTDFRRAGMGVMPSPRGRFINDLAYKQVGCVSAVRECLTPGRVGAWASRSCVPLPLVG